MKHLLGGFLLALLFAWFAITDLRRGFVEDGKFVKRRYCRDRDPITFWFEVLLFGFLSLCCLVGGAMDLLKG